MLMPVAQGGHQLLTTKITLSSNTTNYNLANDLTNNYGWNGTDAIEVELTINSSINVFSTSTTTPAITAHLVAGSILTLNNSGNIIARGGAGGAGGTSGGAGSAGGAGGHAISLQNVTATINNLSGAVIAGGGGGGGGNGSATGFSSHDTESGCTGSRTNNGGAGGSGASTDNPPTNSPGTRGGSWGNAGSGGSAGSTANINGNCITAQGSGGAGGAAGKAIRHVSGVTQTLNNSGTTHGATS
jgi:hypothetical protein